MAFADFFTFRNIAIGVVVLLASALIGLKIYRYVTSRNTPRVNQRTVSFAKPIQTKPQPKKISGGPNLKQLIKFYNSTSGSSDERMKKCLTTLSPKTTIPENFNATGFSGFVELIARDNGLRTIPPKPKLPDPEPPKKTP